MTSNSSCCMRPCHATVQFFASFLDSVLGVRRRGRSQTPPHSRRNTRTGRDCVLVLDASGSMDADDWPPTRLGAAKEAAKAFVRCLASNQPDSCVAIVSYAEGGTLHCSLMSVSCLNRIERHIDSIKTRGMTDITAGLAQANSALDQPDNVGQVVLLTDGHHNHGPSPEAVASAIRGKAILEIVGIGGSPSDVQESLLKAIASENPNGSKRYRWIGDRQQLIQHFRDLGGGLTRE